MAPARWGNEVAAFLGAGTGAIMATTVVSAVGPATPTPAEDAERLDRRDLLVLKLEVLRRRRELVTAAFQRATRSTR